MTLLAELAAVSRRVSETRSRLAKVREIAACLGNLDKAEIPVAIAYLSGEIRQGKLGVAYASLHTALRKAPSATPTLTLLAVDEIFTSVAAIKGPGSNERRSGALEALFERATAGEQDFLTRLIAGELRQGALRALMLEAMAAAAEVPLDAIRKAAMSAGGLGEVAEAVLTQGRPGLAQFSIRLMQPVLPMLSQSAPDTDTALEALGTAAFEWKLDGARIQVHKAADDVRVYTRNLNDVTDRVPEVVAAVKASPSRNLILDGEVMALRPDGSPLSFQMTMRRFGRKLDVEAMRKEIPLSAFFFDCLLRDDAVLTDHPAEERFRVLAESVPPSTLIPRIVTADRATAGQFLEAAIARGHEGVMAKSLKAPYEAGRRGAGWIKIKRANTLDLVVLGAEWGHGRRSGKLSNLHLGARDPVNGGFVMLGKTFKGLTDQMLEWQTETFLGLETSRDAMTVYVRPEIVVEIAFNEIQASPRYPGGLALRFARVKGYRPDKRVDETDTIDTVRGLYSAQVHA
jgi:DNA ligase-1